MPAATALTPPDVQLTLRACGACTTTLGVRAASGMGGDNAAERDYERCGNANAALVASHHMKTRGHLCSRWFTSTPMGVPMA